MYSTDEASMTGRKLIQLVGDFIEKHDISCSETIYQVDSVIIDAYEFIESLVEVIGYKELDDAED